MEMETKVRWIWLSKWYLKVPKSFLKHFGLTNSVYLSALIEWHLHLIEKDQIKENEEFFMSRKLIEFNVGLTEDQQRSAIKQLKELKIIQVRKIGLPPINHYRINYEKIQEMIYEDSDLNNETRDIPLNNEGNIPSTMRVKPLQPYNKTKDNKTKENKDIPYGMSDTFCEEQNVTYNKTPSLLIRKNPNPIEFQTKHHTYRKDVMSIISYWNNSPGLPRHHIPNSNSQLPSKTFLQILKIIGEVVDGKFLQAWPSYSVEDIIRAIDGFKIRFTNPDYSPANKSTLKSVNLTTFFWNTYSSYIPSMFLECLNNPPILLKNTVPKEKELNPQLTIWLQQFYTDKVLLGQPKIFNQVEINKFIKGSNLLVSSMTNLRKRANLLTGPMEFCEYVVDALLNQFPREQIQIGNISSEWTYTELLPRYLGKLGRID